MSDSEQLRVCYEGVVRQNPSNVEAVHYLALWHLERHSFQQVCSGGYVGLSMYSMSLNE